MFLELLEFLNIYFGLLIHLWKGFILFLESSSTFRWNCNLPKLERPINSTSDLVKIICPLICSFLTLQYTLFGFQWSLSSKAFALKFWWAQVDSNHRPRAYQARALTTWAMSPFRYFGVSRSLSPFFSLLSRSTQWRVKSEEWRGKKFRCAKFFGGDDGIRTHDPLLAGQVLSQLSYTPMWG